MREDLTTVQVSKSHHRKLLRIAKRNHRSGRNQVEFWIEREFEVVEETSLPGPGDHREVPVLVLKEKE